MSGSSQTWPFEQIPAMSGYPPKDSEYDSYWSHRNAGRPQVRFRLPSAAKPLRAASGQGFRFFGGNSSSGAARFLSPGPRDVAGWSRVGVVFGVGRGVKFAISRSDFRRGSNS